MTKISPNRPVEPLRSQCCCEARSEGRDRPEPSRWGPRDEFIPRRPLGGRRLPPPLDPIMPRPPIGTGGSADAIPHRRDQPLPKGQWFNPEIHMREGVGPHSIQDGSFLGRDNLLRFEVRPGDVHPWDSGNIGPGGKPNQRAEVLYTEPASVNKHNSPYNVDENTGLRQYRLGFGFEEGFPKDTRWATLLQFHPDDKRNGDGWTFGGVSIHKDSIDFRAPGSDQNIASLPLEANRWYDIRMDVNWSSGQDGYVKIYDGDQLIGSWQGQTAKPGAYYYMMQGLYRDGATNQTGVVYQTPVSVRA